MLFRQLFDYDTWTYTYLIADLSSREAVLVDSVIEQVDRDLKLLRELGLTLRYCLETHIHADHITGTGKLRELTGCQGIVPEKAQASCADRFIEEGEVLQVGTIQIQAIATPGHTDSHMAYFVKSDPAEPGGVNRVLTGDALFIRGSGRTDFQSGDAGMLYDSVTQKLFTLPDDTLVYPAHDYRGHTVSTIAEEKRWNPRFVDQPGDETLKDRSSFIEFMNNLNLPDPKKIMEAVPANERCGRVAMLA
jgi:glyoxylase-like metal-dependent hydrolase (beta-lactamase superfamily II)